MTKLIVAPSTLAKTSSAPAPNSLKLQVSTAAHLAPREEDRFVPRQTGGDQAYGSLKSFVDAWNAADLAEVNSNPKPHPAGPSALGQKMHDVMVASDCLKQAIHTADETAKVRFHSSRY